MMKRRRFLRHTAFLAAMALLSSCTQAQLKPTAAKKERILVIGAGIAGLAAAATLRRQGFTVTILEARDRLGGRLWTDRTWPDLPLDLGASWIHGVTDNPISRLATEAGLETVPTDYDSLQVFGADGRPLAADRLTRREAQMWTVLEEAQLKAEIRENDLSVAQALAPFLTQANLTPAEQQELNYLFNSIIEHEFAADLAELSIWWFDEGEVFGGGDVLFPGGYDRIAHWLAEDLDVRLGHVVQEVAYHGREVIVTTLQDRLAADRVIVTLPLGVLKQGVVKFAPVLPAAKQTVIERLGMGLLNKLYLRFEAPFWGDASELIGYVAQNKGEWAEFLNLYVYFGQPTLLAFNAGSFGRALERLPDEQLVDAAMTVLRRIYGPQTPAPLGSLATRWATDPFAYGSYSYLPPGASPADRQTLARPVAERLFFAGEATSSDYPATVHGAYLSGVRAAKQIADLTG
ncbi:MAG TPA: FAD-dependent oxidoreductase [Anaerolineae bacterium]|nr:FAD-dependent oxidoreductase [Anaerolineae bacterium]